MSAPHDRRVVLILGGTRDAREFATVLARDASLRAISSLAGRTAQPLRPEGEVRIGGFGGVDGLVTYLRCERIAAVVDATHPFAAAMSANAAAACARVGIALVALDRPAWVARPGDRFIDVPDVAQAARVAAELGRRIFVTVGRQELAPFAEIGDRFFLVRAIEAPDSRVIPAHAEVLLARGPFVYADELALCTRYAIDCIVAKNSGGEATAAKLDAARTLGIPIVMIGRPPSDRDVARVTDVAGVTAWLYATLGARAGDAHAARRVSAP